MSYMKRVVCFAALFAIGLFLVVPSTAVADFANPGFEAEAAGGDPAKAEDWTSFAGGGDTAERSNAMPRNGDWGFLMQTRADDAGFAGAFQEFAVSPGDPIVFTAWAKADDLADGTAGLDDDGDPATQMRMRFEWRSGGSGSGDPNTQINITGAVTDQYQKFTVSDVAPAGVDAVRAVFALNRNDDKFYFDDVSFSIVPEPASLGLAMIAGLGLLCGRRRS